MHNYTIVHTIQCIMSLMKQTLIQYFEWYYQGNLWKQVQKEASYLSRLGFTKIWLPPAYKGQAGKNDVGYGAYDLYDLGEFDQKGAIETKYGTKDDYIKAIQLCQKENIEVLADIVLNHKMGADAKERIKAHEMDWNHRNQAISDDQDVEVWTKYTFPGRNHTYSSFTWDWTCFDGTDYDALSNRNELLEFQGKAWDENVSKEDDNFDFIMGDDLDFDNQKVVDELYTWGKWYYDMTHVDGYRLDAIKSIDSHFFTGWLASQRDYMKKDAFAVGEYWNGDVNELLQYIDASKECMTLFDVSLHFRLYDASYSNGQFDMRTIFDQTLTELRPNLSVAFVDNHDTQLEQSLESWVDDWFRLHAYALILLTECEYPCVFYGDLYGIEHNQIQPVPLLKELIWLRSHIEGEWNIDYQWDDPHCIGWKINEDVIVVMTNQRGGTKNFSVSKPMVELYTQQESDTFSCIDGGCSIYVEKSLFKKMREEIAS